MRVLVVEDEEYLAEAIATGLRREAMAVDVVGDGAGALEQVATNDYDILVLDRDLPVIHGDEVCRRVVAEHPGTRILMLAASRTLDARVGGFELGADDYLIKPFAFEELEARCEIANRADADIFLSIHADAFTNPEVKGTTAYYYTKGSAQSRRLADSVRTALIDSIGTVDRGTQTCNFYVVKHTDMPAILVEISFISNPDEERMMNSEAGIKKIAQGIADGIADYFG